MCYMTIVEPNDLHVYLYEYLSRYRYRKIRMTKLKSIFAWLYMRNHVHYTLTIYVHPTLHVI